MEITELERYLSTGKIPRGYKPKRNKLGEINYDMSQVKRDKDKILWTLWRHQVIDDNGPIEQWKLLELSEMSYNWFELILYLILRDPNSKVIRNTNGRIGYL